MSTVLPPLACQPPQYLSQILQARPYDSNVIRDPLWDSPSAGLPPTRVDDDLDALGVYSKAHAGWAPARGCKVRSTVAKHLLWRLNCASACVRTAPRPVHIVHLHQRGQTRNTSESNAILHKRRGRRVPCPCGNQESSSTGSRDLHQLMYVAALWNPRCAELTDVRVYDPGTQCPCRRKDDHDHRLR
ncbi:hypothetical protein GY45DRAFT_732858 [Cubamyces sp. BRFM 1775]|nr:hypothetical protein GY45DRAFT_732858 [Cubamyces sp. BRFM 1775]